VSRLGGDEFAIVLDRTTPEQAFELAHAVRRSIEAPGSILAIDDFGTGYSSLSYLKELPVDVLKIDRSFVSDLPDSHASLAIVAAAIELSHRLGLEVVAEGVETQEQYDCLVELGCDLIQGYHISRPVSAAKLTKMIEAAMPRVEAEQGAAPDQVAA
jgi:EAL domain-containing protein (putative c-di-GMP-specific phosphodiesterase class I)